MKITRQRMAIVKRKTFEEIRRQRLDSMGKDERAAFDVAFDAARLAIEVGEQIREAREAAGLSQRELARQMSTSQAAVARLEAGGVAATLTTLHKAAAALDMRISIGLSHAD